MSTRSVRALFVTASVALLAVPAVASASPTQLTGIADDRVLENTLPEKRSPVEIDAIVKQWKAAGVQDVRTFAQWDKLAPKPDDINAPAGFEASNPAAYNFTLLDSKLDLILRNGMTPTLVISGPGPVWGSSQSARRKRDMYPDPEQFGAFAKAVATHVADRVERYIVWNEPNVATWLKPQNTCDSQDNCKPYAPHLYRELAREGYEAIHDGDDSARVAIGGTSSLGNRNLANPNTTNQPLRFLREMACVNSKYRPIKSGRCKSFKPLSAEALSYHPHSQAYSPGKRDSDTSNARMADLSRLTRVIDKLVAKKRIKVKGAKKLPLWLDEYAYETKPDPNKSLPSPSTAATWSQWGWSIAARNPRVQIMTQYVWFDEEPTDKDASQWDRWQSGLYTAEGKAKPLARVFSHPIFGWRTSKSAHVWGQVRTATGVTSVKLQRRSGKSYRDYKTVKTNRNGIFQVKVPRSSKARYRFRYTDPSGDTKTSAVTKLRKTS
ncbi:MAG: hypothetical protein ITG02_10350 [Patulibacter sp.]|nr:hypothetical protein [Patulibacter sp.]